MARAYVGDELVADQFYSGRGVWEIGVDRVSAGVVRLRVLPLGAGAPVHVPGWVGTSAIPAEVLGVEWVAVRAWSFRAA